MLETFRCEYEYDFQISKQSPKESQETRLVWKVITLSTQINFETLHSYSMSYS